MLHGIPVFIQVLVVIRWVDEIIVFLGDNEVSASILAWETVFLRVANENGMALVAFQIATVFVPESRRRFAIAYDFRSV